MEMMYELHIEWGKGVTYSGRPVRASFNTWCKKYVCPAAGTFFLSFDDGHCAVIIYYIVLYLLIIQGSSAVNTTIGV
jgi:hypothetical protein